MKTTLITLIIVAIVVIGIMVVPKPKITFPEPSAQASDMPSTVTKFTDGDVQCYLYISDLIAWGNTNRIGGISCVK